MFRAGDRLGDDAHVAPCWPWLPPTRGVTRASAGADCSSTPKAATVAGLPLRVERGSLIETAPQVTMRKAGGPVEMLGGLGDLVEQ